MLRIHLFKSCLSLLAVAFLIESTGTAAPPPPATGGVYIGGYSGNNNRGGYSGVYIGGHSGSYNRPDSSGTYIGGYPGVSYQDYPSYPSTGTGYKGYSTRIYPPYPRDYSGAPRQERSVTFSVRVPADAEIWFDGKKTLQKGSLREFVSPPLAAGKRYTYTLRVRWKSQGQSVEESREVSFQVGDQVKLEFPSTPK
jgi:uncharacterized protein (TIGR03000 family)